MTRHGPILVLGGSGKTGRRVVERLSARGHAVKVGSRTGAPPFDWDDRATWAPVLEGVGAAYISFFPDLAMPGAADAVRGFAALAVASGVRRLVLLSGRGEPEAQRAEEGLKATGADWTILKASWFSQNFSESFLLEPLLGGEIALPVGDVREPFVDTDDIADVAVAALTEDGHVGRLYELTGPRALTFAEATAEIAAASGRALRYVEITPDAFADALATQNLPAGYVSLFMELFTEVLDGRNASPQDGVRRALGRDPRDFTDYARAAAATGVWGEAR